MANSMRQLTYGINWLNKVKGLKLKQQIAHAAVHTDKEATYMSQYGMGHEHERKENTLGIGEHDFLSIHDC